MDLAPTQVVARYPLAGFHLSVGPEADHPWTIVRKFKRWLAGGPGRAKMSELAFAKKYGVPQATLNRHGNSEAEPGRLQVRVLEAIVEETGVAADFWMDGREFTEATFREAQINLRVGAILDGLSTEDLAALWEMVKRSKGSPGYLARSLRMATAAYSDEQPPNTQAR